LEHFKAAYDNKAFTLSHCWIVIKDSKKWEDSFVVWQELEEKKKEKGNDYVSTDGVINLDDKGECLGNPKGEGLASVGWARWPAGHMATKYNISHQAGSLAFQETFKELMVKKKEAIGREGGEVAYRERGHHQEIC
jgi:hypothetical protein